jgi:SAM-dependent methyltransferase
VETLSFLKEKKESDLDAPGTTLQHCAIILRKPLLKKTYIRWYRSLLKVIPELPEGKIVEIGSGGGFLKSMNDLIITSDILDGVNCDMTFSAEDIPFGDNSLSAIFMVNVLHHITDCKKFFGEANRTLQPGGKIIMVEPANTPFAQLIFKNFHHENFDPESKDWSFHSSGPLSGANGALPWIIFNRDYALFSTLFPNLKKEQIKLHTPFAYLLSGGLSLKSLLPGFMFGPLSFFELLISPLNRWIAVFQTITVKKELQE